MTHRCAPFWQTKSLGEMTAEEWESLCDGCGQCCLLKLEDEDTLELAYTGIACALLDISSCRCTDYAHRTSRVPGCLDLTAQSVPDLGWLPPSCAYRLIAEGKELPGWHPLVTGDPESVHAAGMSVRVFAISEEGVAEDDLEDHVRPLPGQQAIWK